MRLRVLGPIELAGDAGRAKVRTLLAMLAIHRGTVCSVDALIDALWGESPPASAAKLVNVYVSQLRRVLPPRVEIWTEPAGYLLVVDPPDVDSSEFERLAGEGRAALAGDNAALAASILRRALALWRGPAYADIRYEEFARDETERLETMRRLALGDRLDADLQLGRHAEVLGELRGLIATDPADERVAALAILAAYRAEGQTAAMELYEQVRRELAGELGAEPGAELIQLRDRIARADPSLLAAAVEGPGPSLPAPPNALIGRDRELVELQALLTHPNHRLVSLTGAGGSGKSRLALELGRAIAPSFGNGAALVELASLRDPDLVLSTLAHGLGVDPGANAFAALTDSLRDRELLLIVDNAEHLRGAAPDLVRLLAAAPRLVVVVTTRVVLHVSGEHVYPVGPLGEADAVALFDERARALDPSFALDAETTPVAASICRRLDSLPLPIELAAARIRSLGLRGLESRLASRLTTLSSGPRDLPARQQTLRETLDWSVNLLTTREREILAALSVFPAGCASDAAWIVAEADDDTLGSLVDHHLVQTVDVGDERRFRLLETVREYADELLGERHATVGRAFIGWMRDLVDVSDFNALVAVKPAALDRMEAEIDNLREALRLASADPDPSNELAIAAGVWRYWWIRGHLAEGRAILEEIVARRGPVATRDGVRALRATASLAWSMGDREAGSAMGKRALELATEVRDPFETISVHNLFGVMATSDRDHALVEHHQREAIRLADLSGLTGLAMTSRMNLGATYLDAGRLDEARDLLQQVLEFRMFEANSEGTGFAHINLGEVEFDDGNLEAAEAHYMAAVDGFRRVGFRTRMANALQGLAAVEARTGRPEAAARHLGEASALLSAAGWGADGDGPAPTATAEARSALGDEAFERLFAEGVATAD
jgi:predicted ATPase/DNA-binding SARP family transcriptional activator